MYTAWCRLHSRYICILYRVNVLSCPTCETILYGYRYYWCNKMCSCCTCVHASCVYMFVNWTACNVVGDERSMTMCSYMYAAEMASYIYIAIVSQKVSVCDPPPRPGFHTALSFKVSLSSCSTHSCTQPSQVIVVIASVKVCVTVSYSYSQLASYQQQLD